jgi:DNA-binding MarR family transcriptional regulator
MNTTSQERYLELLEQIDENPQATQASLADKMGVAIGTVNWHLKRMVEKGYLKVSRAGRRKLQYVITPEGIALRAKLAVDYVRSSMDLYRLIRNRMTKAAQILKEQGITEIALKGGAEEVRDICRLTCLEQGIVIREDSQYVPVVLIDHLKIFLPSLQEDEDSA